MRIDCIVKIYSACKYIEYLNRMLTWRNIPSDRLHHVRHWCTDNCLYYFEVITYIEISQYVENELVFSRWEISLKDTHAHYWIMHLSTQVHYVFSISYIEGHAAFFNKSAFKAIVVYNITTIIYKEKIDIQN